MTKETFSPASGSLADAPRRHLQLVPPLQPAAVEKAPITTVVHIDDHRDQWDLSSIESRAESDWLRAEADRLEASAETLRALLAGVVSG